MTPPPPPPPGAEHGLMDPGHLLGSRIRLVLQGPRVSLRKKTEKPSSPTVLPTVVEARIINTMSQLFSAPPGRGHLAPRWSPSRNNETLDGDTFFTEQTQMPSLLLSRRIFPSTHCVAGTRHPRGPQA